MINLQFCEYCYQPMNECICPKSQGEIDTMIIQSMVEDYKEFKKTGIMDYGVVCYCDDCLCEHRLPKIKEYLLRKERVKKLERILK